jgi:predicted AAA+ superfamily ATPase
MISHPKFYFFDVGVYRAIRPKGPLDSPQEAEGVSFESLFFQEVMAINHYLNLGYKIYYWRTSNGQEVDFILYGEKGFKAFEIKRRNKITSTHTRELNSFHRDYPEAERYLIYGGKRNLRIGNIKVMPIVETLKNLPDILKSKT